ncbi:MAG: acetyl-CoA carboxylase biotin carboxylase subunit [Lautropia sp.]
MTKPHRDTSTPFDKILIANRGEIACRVIRTARRLGVRTVAVYSDADAGARHVALADEAVRIGPAPARESYLDSAAIISAALATGAAAIHPGYGFLSENDAFCEACRAAGIVFIGPPAQAIRAMGLKSASKRLMAQAGVPLTPGYHGEDQDPSLLADEARRIGFPVLIKASAGGGGKGMRIVERASDFAAALDSCRREAASSFGDDAVLIEKYVQRPRHVEIQVFADTHGRCVHLFERDCSVQRRHQKVLEEAPAPGMTPERRAAMGRAAVEAALAVGYVGAGTVEFIADQQGNFWFMEMNTRLQVEHPVTEMITGVDLVEWQLRIAAGEPLPRSQEDLQIDGHAIEARIYAEDPAAGFLPSSGRLLRLRLPPDGEGVRVDSGVDEGDAITPHYDPMIAKLIAHGRDRATALARLRAALDAIEVAGVANNVAFLGRLVSSPAFVAAELDTGLIEREGDRLVPQRPAPPIEALASATIAELDRERVARRPDPSPWAITDGWRANHASTREMRWRVGSDEYTVIVLHEPETGAHEWRPMLEIDGSRVPLSLSRLHDDAIQVRLGDRRWRAVVSSNGERRHVLLGPEQWVLTRVAPLSEGGDDAAHVGGLVAPMPGKVIAHVARAGARVARGDALLVLEAMKMEHTISAPAAGTLVAFRHLPGAQVDEGAMLVDFTPDRRQSILGA